MHIHHFKVLCVSKRYKIPVFRALVPEQLEPERSRLLGRGAKRTGFEVGSKSFINMHTNISVRTLRTGTDHALLTPICCGPAMCCGIGG